MQSRRPVPTAPILLLACAFFSTIVAGSSPARAQEPRKVAKQNAAVVVDGTVRQTYRRVRDQRTDYVVEIEVRQSQQRGPASSNSRPSLPAPGDRVLVKVFQQEDPPTGFGHADTYAAVPDEQAVVRVYLVPNDHGQWIGTYPDWFDLNPGPLAETTKPAAPSNRPKLGLSAETVRIGNRAALKVTKVQTRSPAERAGIEPGDLILTANGQPIGNPSQFNEALARGGRTLRLMVRDGRTGKEADLEIPLAPSTQDGPTPNEIPNKPTAQTGLGAATDLTFYEDEAAVKVTEVEPNGPAAKAGLQVGTIILEANGQPVLHPRDLADVIRKSSGPLRLQTVDPRTGAKRRIEVNLNGDR
jgi:membrane-associated protease RseP (regulator of RpoE activity)